MDFFASASGSFARIAGEWAGACGGATFLEHGHAGSGSSCRQPSSRNASDPGEGPSNSAAKGECRISPLRLAACDATDHRVDLSMTGFLRPSERGSIDGPIGHLVYPANFLVKVANVAVRRPLDRQAGQEGANGSWERFCDPFGVARVPLSNWSPGNTDRPDRIHLRSTTILTSAQAVVRLAE